MNGELLLVISAFGALAYTSYWMGRGRGEGDRATLLAELRAAYEEINLGQQIIDDLTDVVVGTKPTHPALRAVK